VLGENELQRRVVGVKPLREEGEQLQIALDELPAFFSTKT
jgi:hypothetical protein